MIRPRLVPLEREVHHDITTSGAGKVGNSPGGGEQGARWKGETTRTSRRSGFEGKQGYANQVGPMTQPNRMPQPGLKPKDLVGIPWMLAFALRDAGWWLREDIVWQKPNPMPESVQDRCTRAHEYLFHFSHYSEPSGGTLYDEIVVYIGANSLIRQARRDGAMRWSGLSRFLRQRKGR